MQLATTRADAPTPWRAASIRSSDTPPPYTLEVALSPSFGTVEIDGTQVRYLPPAQWSGVDTFRMRACDARGACSEPAVVNVALRAQNHPPRALGAALSTDEDTASSWVSAGDLVSDPDAQDDCTVTITQPSPHGRVEVYACGVRFHPAPDYHGETAFSYAVCDAAGACSDTASVQVRVAPQNDPPALGELDLQTKESVPTPWLRIPVQDPDEGDVHAFSAPSDIAGGQIQVRGNEIRFVPLDLWAGTTDFALQVCDGGMLCAERRYNVSVADVNEPPLMEDLLLSIDEDTPSERITPSFFDTDADETYTLSVALAPTLGTVELFADPPGLVYTPYADVHGSDRFSIVLCDRAGLCDDADVSVDIAPRNDPPHGIELVLFAKADRETPWVSPHLIDPDPDDAHTIQILSQPPDATLEVGPDGLSVRGLPRPGFAGLAPFRVRVCDRSGACADADARMHVSPAMGMDNPTGAIRLPRVPAALQVASRPVMDAATGNVLTGTRDLRIQYSPDAIADLEMDGSILRRGETLLVTDYDFAATAGRVVLPLSIAEPRLSPTGRIGTLRIAVIDPVATDVVADVVVWDPAHAIVVQADADVVARRVQSVSVHAAARGDAAGDCTAPLRVWRGAAAVQPSADALGFYCALEWTSLPDGLEQVPSESAPHLSGYLNTSAESVALGWRTGILIVPPQGEAVFAPSPQTTAIDIAVIEPTPPRIRFEAPPPSTHSPADRRSSESPINPDHPIGTVQVSAEHTGISIEMTGPDGAARTVSGGDDQRSVSVPLFTTRATPEGAPTFTVRAAYLRDPGRVSVASWTAHSGAPPAGEATAQAPVQPAATATTATTVPALHDASPIPVTLSAGQRPETPGVATIAANLAEASRRLDLQEVIWQVSSDGTTFSTLQASRPALAISEPVRSGPSYYRAITVNRHSGERFESLPLLVQGSRAPKCTVSGYRETLIDNPVQWRLVCDESAPIEAVWEIDPSSQTEAHTGETAWIPADRQGTRSVRVKTRFVDGPREQALWSIYEDSLAVLPPFLSPASIVGPSTLEAGKTYTFSVDTSAVIQQRYRDRLELRGIWRFPDGSALPADTVSYTAKSGDSTIEYIAWIEGHEAATRTVATKSIRVREYTWPTFVLYKRILSQYTPTTVQYAIKTERYADTVALGREPLTYDFALPDGGRTDPLRGNVALARFSEPGLYRVVATVSDTRGNRQVIDDVVTVDPPPPLSASLASTPAQAARVPFDLTLRWYANGLGPSERVQDVRIDLDDALLHQGLVGHIRTRVTDPGRHTLRLSILTNEGRRAQSETTLEALAGEAPTCGLSTTGDAITKLDAQATCLAVDGRVTAYQWTVRYADSPAQNVLGVRGRLVRFSSAALQRGIAAISLVGIDDKGNRSQPATWSPHPESTPQ
jgi:ribosomal protein S16